jgi:parallel beta-helix repeat protein
MKNISKKIFFIVCIQGLLGLQQVYAATYYVSPTGVDTNNGTTLTTPVKTIKKALSKAKLSGDIVYVMTGTYVETVTIGQSGITLSAYPNNKPIIDGTTKLPNTDWGDLIYVTGNNNKISGFEVKNSNVTGAYQGGYGVELEGHHNTVSKMNVHHTWEAGIMVTGDYNTVEDSTIWQAARAYINTTASSGWGTGLSAARNQSSAAIKPGITSYATLRRNTVYNNYGEGLSCYEADHCVIEDNIVYDNWTVGMYLSDATNSLVQRNMIYFSSKPAISTRNNANPGGIWLADEVSTVPRSANNTIINNFIYNTDFEAFTWSSVPRSGLNNVLIANNTIVSGGLFTGSGGGDAIVNVASQIRNNIFGASDVPGKTGITFSNNNWSAPPATAKSTTDVAGDPQIAKTGTTTPGTLTSAYFKLLSTSSVINAGMPLTAVKDDFFKTVRGATAPDIGGHEAK